MAFPSCDAPRPMTDDRRGPAELFAATCGVERSSQRRYIMRIGGATMDSGTLPRGRYYPALLAALVFTLSGCATTYGLGQAALDEGRYADAAAKFETALREHPERTDALVGLGITRYKQQGYDEAMGTSRRAANTDPEGGGGGRAV